MPGLLQRCLDEGELKGIEKGPLEVFQERRATAILDCLQDRFGHISDKIIQKLQAVQDIDQLKSLFKINYCCLNLRDFVKNL